MTYEYIPGFLVARLLPSWSVLLNSDIVDIYIYTLLSEDAFVLMIYSNQTHKSTINKLG